MAVFPDRIVLKNSTDTPSEIASAIGLGGTDAIAQGEIVLGLESGNTQLYTLDADGNVITIATGSGAARAIVSDTAPTIGIGGLPLASGDIWFSTQTGFLSVYYANAWFEIAGGEGGSSALTLGGLTDVDLSQSPVNGQVLAYSVSSNTWVAADSAGLPFEATGDLITSLGTAPAVIPLGDAGQVLTVSPVGLPFWSEPAVPPISVGDLEDVSDTTPFAGQILVYNDLTGLWEPGNVAGTGTVTSVGISEGEGIEVTGGPITSAGDIIVGLTDTGVISATYKAAKITVGPDGRITSGSNGVINDLADVNTDSTPPEPGQALVWNEVTDKWNPGTIIGAVTSIIPGNGITLGANGGTGDVEISASLAGPIDGLDDVDTTTKTPVDGEVLAWDNTNGLWVPAPPTIGAEVMDDLTDVNASFPSDGEVLAWNASEGSWEASIAGQGTVTSVGINAGTGLNVAGGPVTGAGTITVKIDTTGVSSGEYSNPTLSVNAQGQITEIFDGWGDPTVTAGDMIYNNGSAAVRLPPGPDNYVLTISSGIPTWSAASSASGGTVSSVAITGSGGLTSSGGPIVESGTINIDLDDTSVTPGNYVNSQITVNSKGQITTASNGIVIENLDDLGDVNTSDVSPVDGQALVWNSADGEWVPGTVSGGGGGSGGGSGAGMYMQDIQVATGGNLELTGIGFSGILQKVSSNEDSWLVLYSSDAARVSDSSRLFTQDPEIGSGVLFEAYLTAGENVFASPGTTYLNNDEIAAEVIYGAIRQQDGTGLNATVSVSAYGMAAITGVNGGTFGSGV